jgi:predicted nuclease of restriction endonuclease-like (RecB) superfamily
MVRPRRRPRAQRASASPARRRDAALADIVELIEDARRRTARAVNATMSAVYWLIGQRIVQEEQRGSRRAGYGEALIEQLARQLTAMFGRGFGRTNLQQMRSFYLAYTEIRQTVSGESRAAPPIRQTLSGEFATPLPIRQTASGEFDALAQLSSKFPLPWSHYVKLLSLKHELARSFYEAEALRGGWTVRQLERQINTQFYERTLLSRDKRAMLRKGEARRPEDAVTPEEALKDPFVLEFLGLKDEYSESDLEEALIRDLEGFLLELGGDFTFVGRQRRLRVGDHWFKIDLLFFHRRLRCLVVIDLKLGELNHADAGQMHLYLNYAREHWTVPGENPPIGLILCSAKDEAVAHYALANHESKVLAAEYQTALPNEKLLAARVERARDSLARRTATARPRPRPARPKALPRSRSVPRVRALPRPKALPPPRRPKRRG